MHALLVGLREDYDHVVLRVPDLEDPTSAALSTLADAVVIFAQAGRTRLSMLEERAQQVVRGGTRLGGAILVEA